MPKLKNKYCLKKPTKKQLKKSEKTIKNMFDECEPLDMPSDNTRPSMEVYLYRDRDLDKEISGSSYQEIIDHAIKMLDESKLVLISQREQYLKDIFKDCLILMRDETEKAIMNMDGEFFEYPRQVKKKNMHTIPALIDSVIDKFKQKAQAWRGEDDTPQFTKKEIGEGEAFNKAADELKESLDKTAELYHETICKRKTPAPVPVPEDRPAFHVDEELKEAARKAGKAFREEKNGVVVPEKIKITEKYNDTPVNKNLVMLIDVANELIDWARDHEKRCKK